jgi:hypothetical protein
MVINGLHEVLNWTIWLSCDDVILALVNDDSSAMDIQETKAQTLYPNPLTPPEVPSSELKTVPWYQAYVSPERETQSTPQTHP